MSQIEQINSQFRNNTSLRPDLVLRPVHPNDARDIYVILSDPRVVTGLDRLPAAESANMKESFEKPDPEQHRLVAEVEGTVIAMAWLKTYRRPRITHIGQFDLVVRPDYWGQRIGTSLAMAILDLADNWLNLKRIEAKVVTSNSKASNLLENLGFELEGTRRSSLFGNGQWQDENLLARLRGFKNQPVKPGDTETNQNKGVNQNQAVDIADVSLRPVHPGDVNALYEIFRQPAVCRTTLQMPSQEICMTENRVFNPPAGIHRLVAMAGEQILGSISIVQRQNPRRSHSAGLGMMVHPQFWGQGIGSLLMEAILDISDKWLNLKRIDLLVNTNNPAGVRLYNKYGFVVEGRKRFHAYGDGRWADSYFMGRLKEET